MTQRHELRQSVRFLGGEDRDGVPVRRQVERSVTAARSVLAGGATGRDSLIDRHPRPRRPCFRRRFARRPGGLELTLIDDVLGRLRAGDTGMARACARSESSSADCSTGHQPSDRSVLDPLTVEVHRQADGVALPSRPGFGSRRRYFGRSDLGIDRRRPPLLRAGYLSPAIRGTAGGRGDGSFDACR